MTVLTVVLMSWVAVTLLAAAVALLVGIHQHRRHLRALSPAARRIVIERRSIRESQVAAIAIPRERRP